MAVSETTRAEQAGETSPGAHMNETLLRSEITFWQEMIACRSDAMPAYAVERMHHALELAESHLLTLYKDYPHPLSQNVYQLDQARRKAL